MVSVAFSFLLRPCSHLLRFNICLLSVAFVAQGWEMLFLPAGCAGNLLDNYKDSVFSPVEPVRFCSDGEIWFVSAGFTGSVLDNI